MKIKRTKGHVILRLTRTEMKYLAQIIDLGLQDVESPSCYDTAARFSEALISIPTEPHSKPKFREVIWRAKE